MFQRTIVAYDGSDRAEDALALALRLRDADGELILACAVTERPWRRGSADAVLPALEAARHAVPAGIRVALRAPTASSPARALTEVAEAEQADLVVIGSSRRSPSGRIWLERTAGRLLQGAPCAVAVAPADVRETDTFHHIGIAYDGSPEATGALAAGYELAARTGAAVTVLYALPALSANEPDTMRARCEAEQMLDAAAEAAPAGVNPRTVVLHGPAGHVIRDACDGIVDLLITGSRGYGPLQRALLGSVAEALMEGATFPVLVLPRTSATAAAGRTPAHAGVEA
jgi:nucleotide-binding universal stress UspA family protein